VAPDGRLTFCHDPPEDADDTAVVVPEPPPPQANIAASKNNVGNMAGFKENKGTLLRIEDKS